MPSILACPSLIPGLSWVTVVVFAVWLVPALLFWVFYGSRRSTPARTAGS